MMQISGDFIHVEIIGDVRSYPFIHTAYRINPVHGIVHICLLVVSVTILVSWECVHWLQTSTRCVHAEMSASII